MRAMRAAELDLVHALDPEGPKDPALMTDALRGLHLRPLPSECGAIDMLKGLDVITDLVAERVPRRSGRRVRALAAAQV
jgi:predicted glycosyltransferase